MSFGKAKSLLNFNSAATNGIIVAVRYNCYKEGISLFCNCRVFTYSFMFQLLLSASTPTLLANYI